MEQVRSLICDWPGRTPENVALGQVNGILLMALNRCSVVLNDREGTSPRATPLRHTLFAVLGRARHPSCPGRPGLFSGRFSRLI